MLCLVSHVARTFLILDLRCSYDLRVFEEARSVRPGFINVWPVGFLTARDDLNSVERPQVRDGKVCFVLTTPARC